MATIIATVMRSRRARAVEGRAESVCEGGAAADARDASQRLGARSGRRQFDA